MGSETQASTSTSYPWGGVPETLHLPSRHDLDFFMSSLQHASEHLALNYHFNSLRSLLNIHSQFRSSPGSNLQDVWKAFPSPNDEHLTCVGLALVLRDLIVRKHPEWKNYLGMAISNEWTRKEPPPTAFWAQTSPPSYPLQCREHVLLFARVTLDSSRKAAILLDPGRCIGLPLLITEDGLPPQSPPLTFYRPLRNREHSVRWGSWDYARWTVKTIRNGKSDSETHMRIYLGRSFHGWPYLEWHNLLFPFRAIMTLTPREGMGVCLRLEVGGDPSYGTIFLLQDQEGRPLEVKFPFTRASRNEKQMLALRAVENATGNVEGGMEEVLERLEVVCSDSDFVAQLLKLWEEEKSKTENSFEYLLHSAGYKDII